jgi:hypothetical protein
MEHGSDHCFISKHGLFGQSGCLTLMGSRSGLENGSDEMEALALSFWAWARRANLWAVVFHFDLIRVVGLVG